MLGRISCVSALVANTVGQSPVLNSSRLVSRRCRAAQQLEHSHHMPCSLQVGKIPKGLPHETATWWFPMPQFGQKLGYAVVICLIDLLESLSIAKALAAKNHYQLK